MELTKQQKAAIFAAITDPRVAQAIVEMVESSLSQAAAVADIATPDATDLASAVTLANNNKAKINALLAALRTAGLVASA